MISSITWFTSIIEMIHPSFFIGFFCDRISNTFSCELWYIFKREFALLNGEKS